MSGLGIRIFDLIRNVATIQKQNHGLDHLQRAMNQSEKMLELMGELLALKEETQLQLLQSMEKDRDQLLLQVRRTLQLCGMGIALVRCAKIESVYGGEMTGALKQVASHIEETIEEILKILIELESRLAA